LSHSLGVIATNIKDSRVAAANNEDRGYIPLDEGGEVMHMAAGRHGRQHVAPTVEVERVKREI